MRRLIVCADDFGLDEAVNEGVERASRDGILTCASLMVGAPAAADAVARARRLPGLRVGLHLVLVDGQPVLPRGQVSDLVGPDGTFDDRMGRAGFRFFFSPRCRRQLAAEIRAQFEAFRATGLALDHVNAHKHMHIHPTVARLLLEIGRDYGLRAVRVPAEPVAVLRRAAAPRERVAAPLYGPWVALLRRRLLRAGIRVSDQVFGLAWSGAMTEARLARLIDALPPGVSELYCHPATRRTPALARTMPSYRHVEELAGLVSPAIRDRIARAGIGLAAYGDLAGGAPRPIGVIRLAGLLGLLGLGLATGLIVYEGLGAVFGALAGAGLGLLWASLFHVVPMLLNARAWQVLLPSSPKRPSLAFFLWTVWVREGVNGLLPVARIGGEVVSARLLIGEGVRAARAVASLVVDVTLAMASQFLFTLLGLGLIFWQDGSRAIAFNVSLGLGITLLLLAALAAAQRAGVFGLFARAFRWIFGGRFDALVGGALPLDRAVRLLYRRQGSILSCLGWQLAGWIAGSGEIWLAAYFLGRPIGVADALLVESLIQATSSSAFVVPGALGVQEGSFLLLGEVVGLTPELSLALALARRARDLIVFVPALIAWQLAEGRRLIRPA